MNQSIQSGCQKRVPKQKLGALEIISGFPIKNKHDTDILSYKINTMFYKSYLLECPLILGAGHPKFKNLQYLLCDLLDLTKPFISVISEL